MASRILKTFVCAAILAPFLYIAPQAEAGVLLRSGQVRSRVRTRTPRMRIGYRTASTWVSVSSKIDPLKGRAKVLSSEKALSKYARNRERYIKELERYERRRARELERRERRRARQKQRELREQKRQQARIRAKQSRKKDLERRLDIEENGSEGSDSSVIKINGKASKSKPSFWRRFWQKLIGRKDDK